MVSVDSTAIELTDAQTRILSELLALHDQGDNCPVKGKALAAEIDRNPGTIRTQMQSLKSLQLVKGFPGPKGGYEPTARAYEVVDLEEPSEYTQVPLRREDGPLEGVTVTEFDLINLHHPDQREAEVHVQGSVRELHAGDTVTVGPAPESGLVVRGVVDGVDTAEHICVITVEDMSIEPGAS